jgi:diphthamide biosynthesis protein 2
MSEVEVTIDSATAPPPTVAPVLSTPDDHLFKNDDAPAEIPSHKDLPEEEFKQMYEIDRTVKELREGGYKRVALQFPDERLRDSERVYSLIYRGINEGVQSSEVQDECCKGGPKDATCCGEKATTDECCKGGEKSTGCCSETKPATDPCCQGGEKDTGCCSESKPTASANSCCKGGEKCSSCCSTQTAPTTERKVFILADTSYAACCVDEIAAEHASADVLVHYGRSCLSPTSRLPVIYVFTSNPLSIRATVDGFKNTYPDLNTKVILMSDVTYASQTKPVHEALLAAGYTNIFPTEIIHDPASPIPNCTVPTTNEDELREYELFHLSEPLPSLLLILSSRVAGINYFSPATSTVESTLTSPLLRRRYALLSHAKSASIIGILVNTLNIKHYLPMISHLKRQIAAAERKSYLVVVGKVNVEKVANFSEIEVWVGIGCWEQGVVGGTEGRGWWRPVITPWELTIALGEREWTGGWIADLGEVLKRDGERKKELEEAEKEEDEEEDDDDEDAPPEFDLRTGRYIQSTRVIKKESTKKEKEGEETSTALTMSSRQKELMASGGVVSPAAMFLRDKRTWQGLGSDLEAEEEGALVEEGRSGVARGYTVGEGERH